MLNVIPTPGYIEKRGGRLSLSGISAFVASNLDKRAVSALATLCREIGEVTGEGVPLSSGQPCQKSLILNAGDGGEGYRLTVSDCSIEIDADGAAGAFYALQSLRQLVRENGASLPCCHIDDAPDFKYRGFYHDVTRGRVPTLKKLKEIVDTLSYFKVNSLQLYIEDAFTFKELEGVVTAECALTPEEILELDEYCRRRFIELIPSMATFGHLFTLLQSEKYSCINELGEHGLKRNYWLERQWHHTVDVYNPETIKVIESMLSQYLPLFTSKYFNICCDETMDLCNGKNQGKDKGEAYFHHVNQLVDIVRRHGKTVMMWGDECMARPEMAKENLPEDVIILNWCYRREVAEWIPKMFWERNFSQIVCTGTSSWENFVENIFISEGNIQSFAHHAKKYGAVGLLNTNWGDFGHVCPFNCNLYGLLFGAEKSWNALSETNEEFEKAASLLLYGIREFNMADTLRSIAKAMLTCNWSEFVIWHSAVTLEGKDRPLPLGRGPQGRLTEGDVIENIEICQREIKRLASLNRKDSIICDLLLSFRAVTLMNRLMLFICKAEGYTDKEELQNDFNDWLSEYSAAWLRDDKPSGLSRIADFVSTITDYPEK